MGITGQSITLANSIIGVGILAMPYCFQQCGILLATLILLLMGFVSRLSSYFLLKSAFITRKRNFEFLAFHIFGPLGKLAVEIGIIGFLMGTCIAYFVVVGDLGPQIIAKIFKINQSDVLRTSIMVIVSLVCVIPLGLLRNVDSLSNVSAGTICFYVCLVMKVIVEAGTHIVDGGWRNVLMWEPSGVLQCVPIFSMALFCQTQLFEVFDSMPTFSVEKMNLVTKNAVNICTIMYLTLGIFGYVAFSSQTISGNVLVSLSPTLASDIIKLGFVMSLAFSFPLVIFPCRASIYSLIFRKAHATHHDNLVNHSIPTTTFRVITVGIVGVTLFVSLLLPSIELVLGLVGSTIGVMICVVFPAAAFINITFKDTNERILAKVILVLGLLILVLGTFANLHAAENKLDKYDDKYITQERIDKIVEEFFEAKRLEKLEDPFDNPPANINENKNIKEQESEVQPPNPVPPEPQSKEKLELHLENGIIDSKLKDNPINNMDTNRQFDSHPKNLSNKIPALPVVAVPNIEPSKEIKQEKPPSDQDKQDNLIKQQLIETIKQHGEEQKELIKEQKEILDEIKKTKEELKTNQKEIINRNEAKKIAVESIQKIADVAIKSISGVTDKPQVNQINKQNEVQEIAKKAVETIEAIKQTQNKINKVDTQPLQIDSNVPNKPLPLAQINNISQIQQKNVIQPVFSSQNNTNSVHLHSPDETQSYKRGEDLQIAKQQIKNIQSNVPLPLAVKPVINEQKVDTKNIPQLNPVYSINNVPNSNILQPNNNKIDSLHNNINIAPNLRQKREVVDCTAKDVLKEGDKIICETLIKNDDNINILPPVNLGDDISLKIPLESIHHGRSLKSIDAIDKDEKER